MSAPAEEDNNDRQSLRDAKIVCVMGGPCSGKSEMSQLMSDEFGYFYISTGELLRKEINKVSINAFDIMIIFGCRAPRKVTESRNSWATVVSSRMKQLLMF